MSRHRRSAKVRPLAEAAENRVRVWQEVLEMAHAEGGEKLALWVASAFFRVDADLWALIETGRLTAEHAVPAARTNPLTDALNLADEEYIMAVVQELQRNADVDYLVRVHLDCRKRILQVLHLDPEGFVIGPNT